MALCVATGLAWHSHCAKQGAVIYIAGGGHGGFARRTRAWAPGHGVDLTEFLSSKKHPVMSAFRHLHRRASLDSFATSAKGYNVTPTHRHRYRGQKHGRRREQHSDMARFVEHIDAPLRIPATFASCSFITAAKASPGQARGRQILRGCPGSRKYMVEKWTTTHMIRLTNKKRRTGKYHLRRPSRSSRSA